MISVLFLKFVGRVKKKSLILGMDSGKSLLFSMFNVDSWTGYGKSLSTCSAEYVTVFVALIGFSAIQLPAERI